MPPEGTGLSVSFIIIGTLAGFISGLYVCLLLARRYGSTPYSAFRHWLALELQDWFHSPPILYHCVALKTPTSSWTKGGQRHGMSKGMGTPRTWLPLALEEDEATVEAEDMSNAQPNRKAPWRWRRRTYEHGTRTTEEKRYIISAVIRMPSNETKDYVPSAHDDGLFVGTMGFSC